MKKPSPNKLYYSISEVSEIADVKAHVLRYWETEFPTLNPKKNRAGNRIYRIKEIKTILAIKHLLYQEGYTISGARKKLKEGGADLEAAAQMAIPFKAADSRGLLHDVRKELEAIRTLLA